MSLRSRLPADAFAYYASLGPDRSYSAVAAYFRVDKRTVLRRAKAEGWQEQVAAIETKARKNVQEKLGNTLEEMNERHLKILRVVLGKAIEALRAMPLRAASDAVRAIEMCVKNERAIFGDPAEQQAESLEEITRREFARWMKKHDEGEGEVGGSGDGHREAAR
jgi:hypothetical protein